eukprot:CAMPEP_0171293154 /NCGR_PEP_ID=MMETSP0816-20121228/1306_1 /TAXON_ID=420281 /ORGANISM="Proboscia inermis, Strain CCAP1064/1" /LENGTH=124 /DNA_ID=CAMNT_0011763695 /DNA_START=116 /DNA_END=491 /DNA_ORIENTATION=-
MGIQDLIELGNREYWVVTQSAVGLIPDMRVYTSSIVEDGFGLLVSIKSDGCGSGGCCDGLSNAIGVLNLLGRFFSPTTTLSTAIPPTERRFSQSNRNRDSQASSNQNTPVMGPGLVNPLHSITM